MMEDFGVEPEVGGTSGIGEAKVGAYKEMTNTAIRLDRLILLSVSLPIWSMSSFRDHYSTSSLLGVEEGNTEKTNEIRKALWNYLNI
jgi:hypothetical protein